MNELLEEIYTELHRDLEVKISHCIVRTPSGEMFFTIYPANENLNNELHEKLTSELFREIYDELSLELDRELVRELEIYNR